MDKKDPPIEPQNYLYGVKVIDFGDLRVARGMSRRPSQSCKHVNLVYDEQERRIWCEDCETNIDPFDVLIGFWGSFNRANSRLAQEKERFAREQAENIHRVAARRLDKLWQSRLHLPCCPHCMRGLTPDDLANPSMISKELELARRKKEAK